MQGLYPINEASDESKTNALTFWIAEMAKDPMYFYSVNLEMTFQQ